MDSGAVVEGIRDTMKFGNKDSWFGLAALLSLSTALIAKFTEAVPDIAIVGIVLVTAAFAHAAGLLFKTS